MLIEKRNKDNVKKKRKQEKSGNKEGGKKTKSLRGFGLLLTGNKMKNT